MFSNLKGKLSLYKRHRFYQRLKKKTINYLSYSTNEDVIKTLSHSVSYVYGMDVEGDIAEFGTMTARTAVVIASAVAYHNSIALNSGNRLKKVHYFDSFEGLPEARFKTDKKSPHVLSGVWGKGTCKGLNEVEFCHEISKFLSNNFFSIYKGWFKDTVNTIPDKQKFSLIHIDGDLYESAIDVLENMFKNQRISKGCIILFDDWNCNYANPKFGERKAFAEVCEKYNIYFSDGGSYGVACHRFIIHSYDSLDK